MGIFNGFPPVSDPSWAGKTRKLLEFLGKPRSWKQLEGWSKRGALLRQSLAWLEDNREAGTFVREGVLYWVELEQLVLLTEPSDNAGGPVLEGEGEIDDDSLIPTVPTPED